MDTRRATARAEIGPRRGAAEHAERSFRRDDVPAVRRFTRSFGANAGIGFARLGDFVLAVSEAMATATACGAVTARVRLWVAGGHAFCEVRGDGRLTGAARPGEAEALRQLVLRRLADHVSVASGPDGARVLLSMTVT
jgi:hypothetical protein